MRILRTHIITLFCVFVFISFASPVQAAISDWQKGASIMPQTNTDLASDETKRSLDDLRATGATYVSFIVPYYQADANATVINRGGNTPTDESLIAAVQYAHSIGLKVSLKMHVETHNHEWRAYINPSDRVAWFASYETILLHYGRLGSTHGIEQIIIGTELINMSSDETNATNTENWEKMIANLRGVYNGKLTYGANWGDGGFTEETNQIQFWDKLDSVGVSAYYWLSPTPEDSVESMTSTWEDWNTRKIKPLHETWNKPVLFTEVGYRSITGAHNHPWNWWDSGEFNEVEQANAYTALFSYWNEQDHMNGVYLWSWETDPNAGGTGDKGYTPQNKQAEQVMKEWFTNPPTEPVANAFTIDGENSTAAIGTEKITTITVKNTSSTSADVLINMEVHSPSYQKVHQEFFSTQHFAPGETKTYETEWTPTVDGKHSVMVGIFNNDWSKNYAWESDVAFITVGEDDQEPDPEEPDPDPEDPIEDPDPTPDEPQSQVIDIWWPSNGSSVSGLQPFKALLSGKVLSEYDMYWQVDGGQLNIMGDSTVDYPHKEVMVDLSGWNWKGANTYKITFVAKSKGGTILGSKSVDIYISNP